MAKNSERKKSSQPDEQVEISMTPMIDVTFLLIIFFLCLKFKTLEGRLEAFLPKDVGVNTTPAQPMEKINVHIFLVKKGTWKKKGERKVWFNRKLKWQVEERVYYDENKLLNGLKQYCKLKRDPKDPSKPLPVTVHAHKGVFYGEVTKTVDKIMMAGFKEVTFAGGYTK